MIKIENLCEKKKKHCDGKELKFYQIEEVVVP
jgi:hypothetical protein